MVCDLAKVNLDLSGLELRCNEFNHSGDANAVQRRKGLFTGTLYSRVNFYKHFMHRHTVRSPIMVCTCGVVCVNRLPASVSPRFSPVTRGYHKNGTLC